MLEKFVDNCDIDAGAQIDRYIANGWYIYCRGLLYTVLRKDDDDDDDVR